MANLILFNKPYQVLSQFTDDQGRATLAHHLRAPNFRVAGRLDYDSEGLLLLTNNGQLQQQIANPRHKMWKTYWVQVEGVPADEQLQALRDGVQLKDGPTLPARIQPIEPPAAIWPRVPPIRERRNVADRWLSVSIREGRNRQVRRMTAAVGLPTLRLVRAAIGQWTLDGLAPGQYRAETLHMPVKQTKHRTGRRR